MGRGAAWTGGNVLKIDPTKYDASSGGFSIDTREELPSLRRINDGSWTAYYGVDISNLDSVLVDLAVVDAGGSVEIRVGSETGNVLATLEMPAIQETMGFVFRRQQTYRARVNQLGLSGPQHVYVVYHAPSAVPIDEETLAMAADADVALVFVGTDDRTASEESDRLSLTLPGNQYDLIKAVAGANPHTEVVMRTLGMVEVDQFKDLLGVPGILWTGYNGQAKGAAMAKILFGEVNPGGKLNSSWYRSVNDLPDISDYDLRGGSQKNGRTYWYFDKEVSYEFGYGLSYSTFKYSNFQISTPTITPNDEFTINADVTNTGKIDGDEVQTGVSASMSDDRFSDMDGAEVKYYSSNDGVLQVDGKGLVTAVGAGAASVTASVTIEGVTLSDSYPLVVLPDLTLDQGKQCQLEPHR
ncbi:MAG: glycoside hydrolase family 3 C-terminal domain-containing protein [Bacteroidales bacterium]